MMSAGFRARLRLSARFTDASAQLRAYIDRMSTSARLFLCDRDILVTLAYFAVILAIPQQAFA